MGKRMPPPLPPSTQGKGADSNNQENASPVPARRILVNDPSRPAPGKPRPAPGNDNVVDIDYDEVGRKRNPWIWVIPGVIILLLVGGGIYAYFYIKEKEDRERKERLEEKEEEEARRQAIADSIAEAERLQALDDSLRLHFTTPDLDFLDLKGHVASVHTRIGNCDGNLDVMSMLLNETTIQYDYDGSFTDLPADLDRYSTGRPSISRNPGGMVSRIMFRLDYGDDTYTLDWSGKRLTSITDATDEGSVWRQTCSSGSSSAPQTASYTYRSSDGSYTTDLSFSFTYYDQDEYGNWRKADVSATGSTRYETQEWDDYYQEWNTRTQTEPLNYTYTIERFINYHEYIPTAP